MTSNFYVLKNSLQQITCFIFSKFKNLAFSLFRNFLGWILEADKQFVILGNMNAITYKEIFPYIKENEIWLGYKSLNQDMYFDVPDERKKWLLENKKEGSAYKIIDGVVMGRLASTCWFTNLDHGKRHQQLMLDTMEHNLKFNKRLCKKFKKDYGKLKYPHYDNYDAIEVPFVDCIPSDFDGVMGVPITFMDKYNPEQFEIIGATESEGKGFSQGLWEKNSGVAQPMVANNRIYKRLFIRPKRGGNA